MLRTVESKGFGKYMVAVSPVVADAEVPCPDASESTACQILSDAEASTQGCAELDTWPAVFTKPLIDLTSRRVPEEDKFGVSSDEDECTACVLTCPVSRVTP